MRFDTKLDQHAQIRALYGALLEDEERFHEFKAHLALYEVSPEHVDEEPPYAAAVRQRLNERIRSWLGRWFDGISALQMVQWRAIVIEERFGVAASPRNESNLN